MRNECMFFMIFLINYIYFFYIIFFISLPLVFLLFFFTCNSAFEKGHLEPWRYINAFIIIHDIPRC